MSDDSPITIGPAKGTSVQWPDGDITATQEQWDRMCRIVAEAVGVLGGVCFQVRRVAGVYRGEAESQPARVLADTKTPVRVPVSRVRAREAGAAQGELAIGVHGKRVRR